MSNTPKPFVLIILDGWGHSESKEGNAIAQAKTVNWDSILKASAHTLIDGSGINVGLPKGQMGNSEVGHLNLGAGRVVYQELTRINQAISDRSFFNHKALLKTIESTQVSGKKLHILGLLSPGGIHSHEDHIFALLELCHQQQLSDVYLHAFLDGRDMPPKSAEPSLVKAEALMKQYQMGGVATISGRYYAMDRDQRWDRIQLTYDLLTQGKTEFKSDSAVVGLHAAYDRNENDEFVKPTQIMDAQIESGDTVIFMNFRADRARQLTRAFTDEDFDGFSRRVKPESLNFISLTQYDKTFNLPCLYPPQQHKNVLGEHIAELKLKQLRIAETEKYAHVTFFFNGGREAPFNGEDRELIPSPKVATYDLQPEMSAKELTEKLCQHIESQVYDLIVCNFANPDMVGHTGDIQATIKAIETIDHCLGHIYQSLSKVNGAALITADHGNAECMFNAESEQAHTAHTSNLVPLVYIGQQDITLKSGGLLSDVAPTILELMNIKKPQEMTGQSLIESK